MTSERRPLNSSALQLAKMLPFVSIITPCYNEYKTIGLLLEGIYRQSYPRAAMEVVIADGGSTDTTLEVIRVFQSSHPDLTIRVTPNPQRITPAALNRAIAAARGDILIRLDAHSIPANDYVERCVAALDQGLGDNVGGVWDIRPGGDGWIARAIAVAASHPLAVGDAQYRRAPQTARVVDTVPFGAFRRELFDRVGLFNEQLPINQDYEFNARIRQHSGVIWLDPAIRSVYIARPTLRALARQYWRYGFWKLRMLTQYPATLRWRQAIPPLFVAGLLGLAISAPGVTLARLALAVVIALYGGALGAAGVHAAMKRRDPGLVAGLPLAMATMHLSWGGGFLWSACSRLAERRVSEQVVQTR
jgi:Glycosyltransferases, probably involved in cell wall biogenesis